MMHHAIVRLKKFRPIWKEEPIARVRAYLAGQKMWSKADEEKLAAECHERIEAAVERYLAMPPRRPDTLFDHLYADLPKVYAPQRNELAGDCTGESVDHSAASQAGCDPVAVRRAEQFGIGGVFSH